MREAGRRRHALTRGGGDTRDPGAGLDPASRNQLWQVVKAAKKDRAIVLTTHSMEEAEELCDRLGIFVDGAMRCLGNPKELTNRYGGFLILTITSAAGLVPEVRAFVEDRLARHAVCTYSLGGMQKFDLPTSEADLASVFAAVEDRKAALGIVDWGVANMTLEEARPSPCPPSWPSSALRPLRRRLLLRLRPGGAPRSLQGGSAVRRHGRG